MEEKEFDKKLKQMLKDWKRDVRRLEYSLLTVEEEKNKLQKEYERCGSLVEKLNNDYQALSKENKYHAREMNIAQQDNKYLSQENEQLKQQLAEKEELLKHAILPKFKVGQEVYIIIDDEIKGGKKALKDLIVYFEFRNGRFEYWTNYWGARVPLGKAEKDLFTTKEEAEKRLEELD